MLVFVFAHFVNIVVSSVSGVVHIIAALTSKFRAKGGVDKVMWFRPALCVASSFRQKMVQPVGMENQLYVNLTYKDDAHRDVD